MKVLIAGEGNTPYFLGRNFVAKGHQVVIVNRNREECVHLAKHLPCVVVHGDASDPKILKESGAMGSDIVLALTPRDQDNLVICQLASLLFGVPRGLALANDPDNTELFERMGISAFSMTLTIGNLIEQRASMEQITNALSVGEGRVNVTELLLDTDSPVTRKPLKDVSIPGNALVAVVVRDSQPIIPRGPDQLKSGDRVVLITLPETHGPVLKFFTGE